MDDRDHIIQLLKNIKEKMPELKKLLEDVNGHWVYEDLIYRFYYQSFKVFYLTGTIKAIRDMLQSLLPDIELNEWFMQITENAISQRFDNDTNSNWLVETRPLVEAFLHAKFFLEMVVKYGEELEKPPSLLPSGWAAVLMLYNSR